MPKFPALLPQLWGKSRIYHRTFFLAHTALLKLRKPQKRRWVTFWVTVSCTLPGYSRLIHNKKWSITASQRSDSPHPEKIELLLQRQNFSSTVLGYPAVFSILTDWTRFSHKVSTFFFCLFYKTTFPMLGNFLSFLHIEQHILSN